MAGYLLQFAVEEKLNSGQATMLARLGAAGLSLRLFRFLPIHLKISSPGSNPGLPTPLAEGSETAV